MREFLKAAFIGIAFLLVFLVILILVTMFDGAAYDVNRFMNTSEGFIISDKYYKVIFDSETDNVYLGYKRQKSNDLTIMYNSNGTAMTVSEYNSLKEQAEGITSKNRFVTTTYKYRINALPYDVVYDQLTDIVYLCCNRLYGNDLTVLLNNEGKAITFTEFEKTQEVFE